MYQLGVLVDTEAHYSSPNVLDRYLKQQAILRARWMMNQLQPKTHDALRQHMQHLQQLPPEQAQRLQDVYPAFENLRPARRLAVRAEIQELRQMRPVERKDRLNNDAGNFSPEEMNILRQVTGIPE